MASILGNLNEGRWLVGGVVAGIVIWLLEGVASMFYMVDMEQALGKLGLTMEMTGKIWALSVLVSVLIGLTVVFFYAASMTRFGASIKTAVVVAVALFGGGYLPQLIGYHMMGMFPDALLVMWGLVGLVELIIATIVGGYLIYRDV